MPTGSLSGLGAGGESEHVTSGSSFCDTLSTMYRTCVCIAEFTSLMHYWQQWCLFSFHLGYEVCIFFQLCPALFFPSKSRPTLPFQKFSSGIMTALGCAWVEFFVLCFLSCSAGKGYFKKNHMMFQHRRTVSLFLHKPSLTAPVKCWAIGSSTKEEIYWVN